MIDAIIDIELNTVLTPIQRQGEMLYLTTLLVAKIIQRMNMNQKDQEHREVSRNSVWHLKSSHIHDDDYDVDDYEYGSVME